MTDGRSILDRAVAAEAAGRIHWPAGFWSWPLAERIRWAIDRLGQSSTSNFSLPTSHFSFSSAHALPLKLDLARRRIGFITPSFASCGGVETWFLSLASRLTEYDWLIAIGPPERADVAAVAVLSSLAQVRAGPGAAEMIAANSDVLIAWGQCETPAFSGPRILVAHGCDQYTRRYVAEREKWPSHCVGVSAAAARVFRKGDSKQGTGDSGSVTNETVPCPLSSVPSAMVIHNGIDPARLASVTGRAATRASWGLVESEIALVHFGRIADDKFPSAPAVAVRELGAPYRSVFVGSGAGAADFQRQVRRLDPLAVFRPPTPYAGDVLAAADVVICCAPSEGFGLTAVEALAAGRPLVSTPVGVIPELVDRFGPVCEIVPIQHNAEQLAEAVRHAQSNEHCHQAEAIRQWLSVERMVEAWRALLLTSDL